VPDGSSVVVNAWIKTCRSQKNFTFLELTDGTTLQPLHVVGNTCEIDSVSLTTGTCVAVKGVIRDAESGRKQGRELHAPFITILGPCDESYPIQKKGLPLTFLREHLHLRPRTTLIAAVLRVRSMAQMSVHHYFQDLRFVNIHTPILTSLDCEGAGELFNVQTSGDLALPNNAPDTERYFKSAAYLTVSGQLHAEIFATALSKVYTFGPTFRAEKSATTRHLSEFWMVEPEIAFADLDEIIALSQNLVKHVIQDFFLKLPNEVEFFSTFVEKDIKQQLQKVLDTEEFAKVEYSEAITILRKLNQEITWGADLQREHEQELCKYFDGPVFVLNWPASLKPFYMKMNEDGKTVQGFDLLVPRVGELVGGSVRENDLSSLEEQMRAKGVPHEPYRFYLDLRQYGSAPHGGFGLGFERLLQYLTGIANIKDVVPVPRYYGEITY